MSVRLHERTGEIDALQHVSDDVQKKGKRVQDKNGRVAFVGLGEQ